MIAGDELTGRLVRSGEDELYDVIVDGCRLTWTELGQALEPFEGWVFRLTFDGTETIRESDGGVRGEGSAARVPESCSTGDTTRS